MLEGEHSAILSTFSKLPFVIKIFVFTIFGWPFYTGFAVLKLGIAQTAKLTVVNVVVLKQGSSLDNNFQ